MPVPADCVTSGGAFPLTADVRVAGGRAAAAMCAERLARRTGLAVGVAESDEDAVIDVRLVPGGAAESYRLRVEPGLVRLTAPDEAGLFYAAVSLEQLLRRDDTGWFLPCVDISDTPRFAYRGAMLDVARHFHPVETVERFIDRISSLKLNALHLHLSDDQGWRFDVRSHPLLRERAAGSSVSGAGGCYSREDYARIVAYARQRHVTVVPEIDLPGHTHALGLAYPALVEPPASNPRIDQILEENGGIVPVAGQPYRGLGVGFSSVKIDDERVYDLVADVFSELAELTPGPYLHFGGDECLGTDAAGYARFVARVSRIVTGLGKIPIAWHEAGVAPDLDLSTVGQYWGRVSPDDEAARAAIGFTSRGSRLIVSPADAIYLDMKVDADMDIGLVWAGGPTSVERSYDWDPAEILPGVVDAEMLGIEAPLWTETAADEADIDALSFPRIASAAEIGWSPARGVHPERTWESFRTRVGSLGPLWTSMGIGFTRVPSVPWVS